MSRFNSHLDVAGSSASTLCAIHCIAAPALVPLLPIGLADFAEAGVEWTFVAIAVVIGTISLAHSYRALHRRPRPLLIFMSGLALAIGARLLESSALVEIAGSVAGSALIVAAHLANIRLTRRHHAACDCACHEEP